MIFNYELVKDKCGKRPKKKKKVGVCEHDTSNMGTSDSTSNIIDSMGHVSETPSDWLTQKMIMQMRLKVSVSQKLTRGDMWFSAPRGRFRFHPHFLDGAVCFHAILFWTVPIPSMHGCRGGGTLKHGHVYKKFMAAPSLLMRNRRVVESPPF